MKTYIVFFAIFSVSAATVVNIRPCSETCTVSEARIEPPCRDPSKCLLKRGRDASVSIDLIPNFAATELVTSVFYESGAAGDLPWVGIEEDACKSLTCPVVAGQQAKADYSFKILKTYPPGTFPVRWIIANKANSNESCCFRMTLKLK